MFEGFDLSMIDTGEVTLRVRHGGDGPPLLLLHGYPHTHAIWHAVAPRLAPDFTVIAPDLRGYGESSKPPTMPDHEPYSKRAMTPAAQRRKPPNWAIQRTASAKSGGTAGGWVVWWIAQ